MSWRIGQVTAVRDETPSARTLVLDVPDWPGNLAGQHLDVRLTAPDGYSAARSYSIATAGDGHAVEITIDELPDGEVSPYLVRGVSVGDRLELRGPLGRWFVWLPAQEEPVQLIAGGSGAVPLMSMIREHARIGHPARFRMLYSVRTPASVFYADELRRLERETDTLEVTYAYTRQAPDGWLQQAGRLTSERVERAVFAPGERPSTYVCGPTPFVEQIADWLVELGHEPERIKTERFGGTAGPR